MSAHGKTTVWPEPTCPECVMRVLGDRVGQLTEILNAVVDAETDRLVAAAENDVEAHEAAIMDRLDAVDEAASALAEPWWAAALHPHEAAILN